MHKFGCYRTNSMNQWITFENRMDRVCVDIFEMTPPPWPPGQCQTPCRVVRAPIAPTVACKLANALRVIFVFAPSNILDVIILYYARRTDNGYKAGKTPTDRRRQPGRAKNGQICPPRRLAIGFSSNQGRRRMYRGRLVCTRGRNVRDRSTVWRSRPPPGLCGHTSHTGRGHTDGRVSGGLAASPRRSPATAAHTATAVVSAARIPHTHRPPAPGVPKRIGDASPVPSRRSRHCRARRDDRKTPTKPVCACRFCKQTLYFSGNRVVFPSVPGRAREKSSCARE